VHGYQFFDLDGREPDFAMICYGRERLYPTIQFERCREGAEDFYLHQTLANAIARKRAAGENGPAVRAAAELLQAAADSVAINQRRPPDGYDPDADKEKLIAAIESLG
jgi:hypothetical protein